MKHPKIAILYSDAKREYFPTEEMYYAEAEVKDRAVVIQKYLKKIGYESCLIPGNENSLNAIEKCKADLVFNLVDSVKGQEYLCGTIPAMLEVADITYTGTSMLGLALSTNKFLTKKLLEQSGVPTPKYQLFNTSQDKLNKTLRFPVISKLNSIHGSVDIHEDAISEDEITLRKRLRYLIKTYKDEVLVEEFIEGRELSAILIEGINKKIYVGEKIFEGSWKKEKYRLATFDAVWTGEGDRFHYKKFIPDKELRHFIRIAYEVLRMDDYAKFDIMLGKNGKVYFIDANPNTALGPKELRCEIGMIPALHGISFNQVLERLIKNCIKDTPELLLHP